MKTLYIYLAGYIQKGKDDKIPMWSKKDTDILQSYLPAIELIFLDPATRSDDLSNQASVFGRDLFQVFSSNLVLVDARDKRGLGVGAEMMFAKMNRIPVVSWVPEESHYNRKNLFLLGQTIPEWIHPFVLNLSDYVAPTLDSAASWIAKELITQKASIKGVESLHNTMKHYLDTQLNNDEPMQKLFQEKDHLVSIVENLMQKSQIELTLKK